MDINIFAHDTPIILDTHVIMHTTDYVLCVFLGTTCMRHSREDRGRQEVSDQLCPHPTPYMPLDLCTRRM